jgi:hypothetical protein
MAQTSSPFGLKIVKSQGGMITRAPERYILSVNSSGNLILPTSGTAGGTITVGAIYSGDPIYLDANGVPQQTAAALEQFLILRQQTLILRIL